MLLPAARRPCTQCSPRGGGQQPAPHRRIGVGEPRPRSSSCRPRRTLAPATPAIPFPPPAPPVLGRVVCRLLRGPGTWTPADVQARVWCASRFAWRPPAPRLGCGVVAARRLVPLSCSPCRACPPAAQRGIGRVEERRGRVGERERLRVAKRRATRVGACVDAVRGWGRDDAVSVVGLGACVGLPLIGRAASLPPHAARVPAGAARSWAWSARHRR